jgi:hypothetical protein
MYLLEQFECRCVYLAAAGDIVIDLKFGNVDRVAQFCCYVYQLLGQAEYLEGFGEVLVRPEQYPERLTIPADLNPDGEAIIVSGVMEPE